MSLLGLPLELFERIAEMIAPGPNNFSFRYCSALAALRLVCREADIKVKRVYVAAHFSKRQVFLTEKSLIRAVGIASHPGLGSAVRTIEIPLAELDIHESIPYYGPSSWKRAAAVKQKEMRENKRDYDLLFALFSILQRNGKSAKLCLDDSSYAGFYAQYGGRKCSYFDEYPEDEWDAYHMIDTVFKALHRSGLKIEHLELHLFYRYVLQDLLGDHPTVSSTWPSVFSNLKILHISLQSLAMLEEDRDAADIQMLAENSAQSIGDLPQLRELVICGEYYDFVDEYECAKPTVFITHLLATRFEQLRELKLKNMAIKLPELQSFVRRGVADFGLRKFHGHGLSLRGVSETFCAWDRDELRDHFIEELNEACEVPIASMCCAHFLFQDYESQYTPAQENRWGSDDYFPCRFDD